jgi:ABC-type siderophore export system fused ATPase/permease subunit
VKPIWFQLPLIAVLFEAVIVIIIVVVVTVVVDVAATSIGLVYHFIACLRKRL